MALVVGVLLVSAVATAIFFEWREMEGKSAFLGAATLGDLRALEYFIDVRGFDPNDTSFGNTTPLIAAAKQGKEEAIAMLVASGAATDLQDGMGRTALMYAAMNMHTACVVQLLHVGAEPEITDRFGEAALDHAKRDSRLSQILAESIEQETQAAATDSL